MIENKIPVALFLLIFSGFLAAALFSSVSRPVPTVDASAVDNLTGWAWSDMPNGNDQTKNPNGEVVGQGSGWIIVNSHALIDVCGYKKNPNSPFYYSIGTSTNPECPPYNTLLQDRFGVNVRSDGVVSGFAWTNPRYEYYDPDKNLWYRSNNFGWIVFSTSSATSGCPGVSPLGDCLARFDRQSGEVVGWARACSVFNNPNSCSGPLATSSRTGDWDGWISLSSQNAGAAAAGVTYGVQALGCEWQGWAWGGDNLGWISFSHYTSGGSEALRVYGTDRPSCAVIPSLRIAPTSVTLILGEKDSAQLHAWFDPDGPDEPDQEYEVTPATTWSSADESKVSIDPNTPGLIHAVDRGQGITITARYQYHSGLLTATASSSIDVSVLPHSHIKEIPPE